MINRAGEMAHQLRVLVFLAEDLVWFPVLRRFNAFSHLYGHETHMWHTGIHADTQTQSKLKHKNNMIKI